MEVNLFRRGLILPTAGNRGGSGAQVGHGIQTVKEGSASEL